jgi:hypothetical protein
MMRPRLMSGTARTTVGAATAIPRDRRRARHRDPITTVSWRAVATAHREPSREG